MSFLLSCPNCGPRRVDEFRYGGELRPRPQGEPSTRDWAAYLYERTNIAGVQDEWWYHRQGCKRWFTASRDTTTNTVLATAWFSPEKGGQDAQEPTTHATAAAGDGDPGP